MKLTFCIILLTVAMAAAQPIDWKDELWYPTNPPKRVFPTKEEQSEKQKRSDKLIADALRHRSVNDSISPDEMFLIAYKLIQTAEKNIQSKEYGPAKENLSQAITCLTDLRSHHPKWGKEIVQFRVDYAQSLLTALPTK